MALFEQQSTWNPNMPLRGFLYCGSLYNKYIKQHKLDIYNRKLIKLPTPQYYVLYNGTEKKDEVIELKLSDAFAHTVDKGEFEWTAKVINTVPAILSLMQMAQLKAPRRKTSLPTSLMARFQPPVPTPLTVRSCMI